MSYITLEAITDTLLKDDMTQANIDYANSRIDSLARGLKVTVATPVPFEVKQLAIAYACYNRAMEMVGKAAGGDGADTYEYKRRAYAAEIKDWENKLTPEIVSGSGGAAPITFGSIPLYRG